MEPAFTPAPPAAGKWSCLRPCLSRAGLAAFCVLVIALFVLAADQYWHLGLFSTKADREVSALVQQLGDDSLTPEKRLTVMNQSIDWNAFAVPVLLQVIEAHRNFAQFARRRRAMPAADFAEVLRQGHCHLWHRLRPPQSMVG